MPANFDDVLRQALLLPDHEREALAMHLWVSVGGQIEDEELIAEIERRCAGVDSGEVETIPFEQAMSEIRESLKRNP
jgi:putative addiction module component (TIGR02574 family)